MTLHETQTISTLWKLRFPYFSLIMSNKLTLFSLLKIYTFSTEQK